LDDRRKEAAKDERKKEREEKRKEIKRGIKFMESGSLRFVGDFLPAGRQPSRAV
jgi:hypothetical protein